MSDSCCVPGSGDVHHRGQARQEHGPITPDPIGLSPTRAARPRSTRGMVPVPAGTFAMGDAFGEGYPADGETPVHDVTLASYLMDATTVTNEAFGRFAKATGYVTDAERFGYSAVFHLAFAQAGTDRRHIVGQPPQTPWWYGVRGADWRSPEGPGSGVGRRSHHPVVHISHDDALAYCAWAGKRLPTEAEWEHAARGGLSGARFAWGDEIEPGGRPMMNVFRGSFPDHSSRTDGVTTVPAKSYEPNGYGLFQMAGNVWEWCSDWFSPATYDAGAVVDPHGPATGTARVMRGGSYLCHASYCHRYRVAARSSSPPDSSAGNLGFRCVA